MPRVSFGTFSMEAPSDWTLSSIVLGGPVEEPPGKGMPTTKAVKPFQRNLVVTLERVGAGDTAEAYVKRQADGLKAAGFPRQEMAPPRSVALANGEDGVIVEQVIVGQGGERVRQMQLVYIRDGIAHTAIASHLDGPSFERAREEFEAMLTSFA